MLSAWLTANIVTPVVSVFCSGLYLMFGALVAILCNLAGLFNWKKQ